jgi:RNA polymerase sigma-70 factor (ECF subfamily)
MYIRVFVPHCADADDILQKTALVMWQNFDTYQMESDFGAWAVGIAQNFVMKLNQRRSDQRIRFSSDIVRFLEETVVIDKDERDTQGAQAQQGLTWLSKADTELLDLSSVENVSY